MTPLSEDERNADRASALLAAIVSSSDDAIISKTLDGIITSWNASAERLFGYTADEAIGQPMTLIIPLARRNEETDILRRIRSGRRVEHFETMRVAKDGRELHVSLTISPVHDRDGRVIGASKVSRDITPQKRATA
ncbi:MAG: PAS domain S-box protein, partial [Burkholderiaceae bacterium]|nr:PAS domain S-box protein [Burkholderiaceae bacterium]